MEVKKEVILAFALLLQLLSLASALDRSDFPSSFLFGTATSSYQVNTSFYGAYVSICLGYDNVNGASLGKLYTVFDRTCSFLLLEKNFNLLEGFILKHFFTMDIFPPLFAIGKSLCKPIRSLF